MYHVPYKHVPPPAVGGEVAAAPTVFRECIHPRVYGYCCDCDFKRSNITVAETGAVVAVAATAGCNNAKRTSAIFYQTETPTI